MALSANNQTLFTDLSAEIHNIIYERREGDIRLLTKHLDNLNYLDYRYPVVANTNVAALLIHDCCTLIPYDDAILIPKFCQLIINLTKKQNITLEGRTFQRAIQWCLKALSNIEKVFILDILEALDSVLKSNLKEVNSVVGDVVQKQGPIERILGLETTSHEAKLLALQVLETCTTKNAEQVEMSVNVAKQFENIYTLCKELCFGYIAKDKRENLLFYSQGIIHCLRILDNITLQSCFSSLMTDSFGLLLSIIKSYMFFGLEGMDFVKPVESLLPSNVSLPESSTEVEPTNQGGKVSKQRNPNRKKKSNKKNDDSSASEKNTLTSPFLLTCNDFTEDPFLLSRLKTSDSDFSDSDRGNKAKLGVIQGRVRQTALSLLFTIVKSSEKRKIFSYWSNFVPDSDAQNRNLFTCILHDPSSKSRILGLNILSYMLTLFKLYLIHAEYSNHQSAFTPFSTTLGCMIIEIHKCLNKTLSDNVPFVIIQGLKCYAALIQSTPYHRIKPSLIQDISSHVRGFIYHKDPKIQIGALMVLGCLLEKQPCLPEVKEVFLKYGIPKKPPQKCVKSEIDFAEFSSDSDSENVQVSSNVPWLLKKCLLNLKISIECDEILENNVPTPVKLESLHVITVMGVNYFESLIFPNLKFVAKALNIALQDKFEDLQLHSARTVDFIGHSMEQFLNSQDDISDLFIKRGLFFWQTLLNGSLTQLFQSENPSLRSIGCDSLGSIGLKIFEELQESTRFLCVTLLFSASRDEENKVQGSAVRALTILLLYPSLKEDEGYIVDTSDAIIRTLSNENYAVRIKSSWSLANLADALVSNSLYQKEELELHSFYLKLFQPCINAFEDSDKVKMNIVRALGRLLQVLPENVVKSEQFNEIIGKAMGCLIKACETGTNMKVKWNACYAIWNAWQNSCLFKSNSKNWQVSAFKALCVLVQDFRHFKVRINAALALSSPKNRENYSSSFFEVWTSILIAIENSEHMENFTEYKHRDQLVEQLCLTLAHVTTLLTIEDLLSLNSLINLHFDNIKKQMEKVYQRLLPEKSNKLLFVGDYLKSFKNLDKIESNTLDLLDKIFIYT